MTDTQLFEFDHHITFDKIHDYIVKLHCDQHKFDKYIKCLKPYTGKISRKEKNYTEYFRYITYISVLVVNQVHTTTGGEEEGEGYDEYVAFIERFLDVLESFCDDESYQYFVNFFITCGMGFGDPKFKKNLKNRKTMKIQMIKDSDEDSSEDSDEDSDEDKTIKEDSNSEEDKTIKRSKI